jgi:hypothetical protein
VEILGSYGDERSLAEVRALVAWLERNGVDAIVEWQGVRRLAPTEARRWPSVQRSDSVSITLRP